MTRKENFSLVLLVGILAFWWNHAFLSWVALPKILQMNDIPAILAGYKIVPNLLLDSGRWWYGSWIQDGIHAYRPLASYLYWLESWLGLHYGFIWVGVTGVLLLTANALLSGVLAWRLTRWKPAVWLAAMLGVSLRFFNWSSATPDYWLAWYPIHQELLMNALLMGALVCFDLWQENAQRKYLLGAWACFVLGALTKEHVYIFPAFALAIALLRRKHARVELKWVLLQCALMAAGVLALWFYRASVLVDPRNPELKRIHLIRKPWLYLAFPLYPFVLTYQFWFPGLALLIFSLAGVLIKWRQGKYKTWLQKPFVPMAVGLSGLAIIALYCQLFYESAAEAFWYLFENAQGYIRLQQLWILTGLFYVFYLLWKYRRIEPTAAAFTLMALSYLPVITYLGWHYTVPAWFVRSAYWALIAKLIWLDAGPHLKCFVPLPKVTKISGVAHEPST